MMLDRLSKIYNRIKEIKKGFSSPSNFKPQVVKDFETMYKEAVNKYNKTNSAKINKIKEIEKNSYTKSISNIEENKQKSVNETIQDAISKASKRYKISPDLINAVIQTESGFNPNSVSNAGAMGLMQLMPGTALQLGVKKPFNIEDNIDGGTRYLQLLLRRYDNNLDKALAAYNAGPSKVDAVNGIPDISETKNYVYKIKKLLK